MHSQEDPSGASAPEEAPLMMTQGHLAAMMDKAVEEALVRERRRVGYLQPHSVKPPRKAPRRGEQLTILPACPNEREDIPAEGLVPQTCRPTQPLSPVEREEQEESRSMTPHTRRKPSPFA